MGLNRLTITYRGKIDSYIINNELKGFVLDEVVERILEKYPRDITLDIGDVTSTELVRPSLDNIINNT